MAREASEIQTEFTKVCAAIGDLHFKRKAIDKAVRELEWKQKELSKEYNRLQAKDKPTEGAPVEQEAQN